MKVTLKDGLSLDIQEENVGILKELFPEIVVDGSVNFDVFRQVFGDMGVLVEGEEKYGLNWHGKKKARQIALSPSSGTLLPCSQESSNWNTSQNVFIEGDNLEVLKLLQKSYANRVKMIYIDPPYNTGNEFIYPDKFADNLDTYLKYTGQIDSEGLKFSSNTESGGRKHTSWLSMMYPRLKLAQAMLRRDGALFVSIDDNEVDKLRLILDEIFGGENFVATIIWQKVYAPKNTAQFFSEDHDYILVYAKDKNHWRPTLLDRTEEQDALYKNPDNDARGPWMSDNLTARNHYGEGTYEIEGPTGKMFSPAKGRYWVTSKKKFEKLKEEERIWWGAKKDGMPRLKRFLSEVSSGRVPQTLWTYKEVGHTQAAKQELNKYVKFKYTENVLNSVKPVSLLKRIIKIGTNPMEQDIVLDFFAGSGPTAQATLEINGEDDGNRRYILVQLPEPLKKEEEKLKTIADLAKSRIQNYQEEVRISDGYKLFKLSSSNIQVWNPDRTDLEESLLSHEDHLVEGRSEQDVLYELLLKRGVDLATPIESREVSGKIIYSIGYGVLFACLDESIKTSEVEEVSQKIVDWHSELDSSSEAHVFFRDSAFQDDISKTNMAAILEQNGISHVRSL